MDKMSENDGRGAAGASTDFYVVKLGKPRFPSPLGLGDPPSPAPADFVPDDRRISYFSGVAELTRALMQSPVLPALEAAGPREELYFPPLSLRTAIVVSGDLCPGTNEVLRSLVRTLALRYGVDVVLGIRHGLLGFAPDAPPPLSLDPARVENIHVEQGCLLGASRGSAPMQEIVDFLVCRNIGALFVIGGEGGQRAALAVSEACRKRSHEIAVIGIPKTIDDEMAFVDRSFGTMTAVAHAREALETAYATARSGHNGLTLVRLPGRRTGLLAARAALAMGRADFVLPPELPFDLYGRRGLLEAMRRRLAERGHAVVALAEGAGQRFLGEERERLGLDASGTPRLADIGRFLKGAFETHARENDYAITVRDDDPRMAIRAARANAEDAIYCRELGANAAHAALSGRTDMLIGRLHGHQVHVPIAAAVSETKRIDPHGTLWQAVLESTGQPPTLVNGP